MTVQEFWKKDAEPTQTYFLTPPEQKVMQVWIACLAFLIFIHSFNTFHSFGGKGFGSILFAVLMSFE
jgi:hypothetical protein